MIESRQNLFDKSQTAREIKSLVNKYSSDLEDVFLSTRSGNLRMNELSLTDFFNFVRKIKYRRDPKPIEIVSRPSYLLKYRSLGWDCKKKAILIASWCKENGIPYRFIGSSNRPDKAIHHIFVQGNIDGEWINLDATYSNYRIGESKQVTKAEIL